MNQYENDCVLEEIFGNSDVNEKKGFHYKFAVLLLFGLFAGLMVLLFI